MLDLEMVKTLEAMPWDEFETTLNELKSLDDQMVLLKHKAATDKELFAVSFLPHYCDKPFNTFHRYYFASRKFRQRNLRLASGAPRGSAKSTVAALIEPLHDACYGTEKFILILSSTTPLANKKLKDIRSEVYTNSALVRAFDLKFPSKKAGESEFTIISENGDTHFMALGKGAEVRGVRYKQYRPSKILLDDVEHSDEVYNEVLRGKTESYFFEDITKAGTDGTNIELIGTILHTDSLLSKLTRNPAYTSRIFKSIESWSEREDLWNTWREIYRNLDDPDRLSKSIEFYESNKDELLKGTKVLWPEKEDYLFHMKDIEEIGMRAFMKEKQNEPLGAEDLVFQKFHFYTEVNEGFKLRDSGVVVPKKEMIQVMAAIDPSTGKASQSNLGDYTCLLLGYKDIKGRVFVHKDFTRRVPPTKYIAELFNLWDAFKYEKIGVETNLYRNLLMQNILDEKKKREKEDRKTFDISFYEIEQVENKIERITRLEPKVNYGRILFNSSLSNDFMNMMRDFPKNKHDDAPDAVEMLWNLAHNRYRPSALAMNFQAGS